MPEIEGNAHIGIYDISRIVGFIKPRYCGRGLHLVYMYLSLVTFQKTNFVPGLKVNYIDQKSIKSYCYRLLSDFILCAVVYIHFLPHSEEFVPVVVTTSASRPKILHIFPSALPV